MPNRTRAWSTHWLLLLASASACSSSNETNDNTAPSTTGASVPNGSQGTTGSDTITSSNTGTTGAEVTDTSSSTATSTGANTNGTTAGGGGAASTGGIASSGTQQAASTGSGGATQTAATSTDTASTTDSGAGGGTGGGSSGGLAWTAGDRLWTGVRYYTGATPSNRTSGPQRGPVHDFVVTNTSTSNAQIDVSLTGPNADWFRLLAPLALPATLEPNNAMTVKVELVTDNAVLSPAPAQDDGATVMRAELVATSAEGMAALDMYALVLTYVELEPTFGQLMDAFPYEVNLGAALENDANPNPTTLPGVESGTDEVAAPLFQKAVQDQPVTMLPLARFSPPGQVPYGWYPPGSPDQSQQVAALGEQTDPHTNNQSRMLEPPLAEGSGEFDPGAAPFGIFVQPDGQATIYSEDVQNSDKQHRLKVFVVHDQNGVPIENTYLLGGEEASNGDYQDYVFLLSNVTLP